MANKKFTYKVGKTTITLPSLAKLPIGVVRKSRKGDDGEALFVIFETLFDEESPEMKAFDSLDADGVGALMQAWSEFSGVSLGESTAS